MHDDASKGESKKLELTIIVSVVMFIYPVSERSPDCFLHSVEIGVHSPKEMVGSIAEGWAWKPRGCKMLPNHHTGAPIHQCRNLNTWTKGRSA